MAPWTNRFWTLSSAPSSRPSLTTSCEPRDSLEAPLSPLTHPSLTLTHLQSPSLTITAPHSPSPPLTHFHHTSLTLAWSPLAHNGHLTLTPHSSWPNVFHAGLANLGSSWVFLVKPSFVIAWSPFTLAILTILANPNTLWPSSLFQPILTHSGHPHYSGQS